MLPGSARNSRSGDRKMNHRNNATSCVILCDRGAILSFDTCLREHTTVDGRNNDRDGFETIATIAELFSSPPGEAPRRDPGGCMALWALLNTLGFSRLSTRGYSVLKGIRNV